MGLLDIFKKKQRGGSMQWTINSSGEWIYPSNKSDAYIKDGYQSLPNVYSIISMVLDKSTIVPFEVYKVKSKSKEQKYKSMMCDPRNYAKALRYKNEAYEKIENSPIEQMLLKPNSYQTTEELWYQVDGYKMLTGNSFLYHIGVGSTNEIHNLPSPLVDIKVKGTPFDPVFNYKVNYLTNELEGEEVMHFKYFNPITSGSQPSEQYKGQSPLQSCRLLLGKYKDADLTQGFQFKNMGPAGMITGTGDGDSINEEQAIQVKDRFKQLHQGVHTAGEVMVTPSKLDWTAFGLSPVDLNITEGKREMLSELCNVYKVPIGLFSDTNSTENNMIESRKSLITDAVIPLVESRKGVLNKFISEKFGEDIKIEFDYSVFHEMQDDIDKQATAASKMYWISPNEKRALTGYDQDTDPNMDKKYFPSGLTMLDDIAEPVNDINEDLLDIDA